MLKHLLFLRSHPWPLCASSVLHIHSIQHDSGCVMQGCGVVANHWCSSAKISTYLAQASTAQNWTFSQGKWTLHQDRRVGWSSWFVLDLLYINAYCQA